MNQSNGLNFLDNYPVVSTRRRCGQRINFRKKKQKQKRILWSEEAPTMNGTNTIYTSSNLTNLENNQTSAKTGLGTLANPPYVNKDNSILKVTPVGYTMMVLIVIIFFAAMFLTIYKLYKRRQIRIQFEQGYTPRRKATKLRIERRYETIEHWIVTKRVLSHDDFCHKVVSNFSHHRSIPTAKEMIDNKDHTKNDYENSEPISVTKALHRNEKCRDGIERQIKGTEEQIEVLKSDVDSQSISDSSVQVSAVLTNEIANDEGTSVSQLHVEEESGSMKVEDDQKRLVHTTRIDLPCDTNITEAEEDDDVDVIASDDADEHECPICMSAFKVDDIVSWSANTECTHVYHHECIKEWLLRHTECCLCKQIMLPVDEKRGKTAKQEALQELSTRYASASSTSYYCVHEGLIRIPKTVRCTRRELKQLEFKIFNGTVPPTDLSTLRGRREELETDETTTSLVAPNLPHNILHSQISNIHTDHPITGVEAAIHDNRGTLSTTTENILLQSVHSTSRFGSSALTFAVDDIEAPTAPKAEEQFMASSGLSEGFETAMLSSQQPTPVTPPRQRRLSTSNGFCTSSPSSTSSVLSMTTFHNLGRVSSHPTRSYGASRHSDMDGDENDSNQMRQRSMSDYQHDSYVSPARSILSDSYEHDIECGPTISSNFSNVTLPSLSNNDNTSVINTNNDRKVTSRFYPYHAFAGRSRSTTTSRDNINGRGPIVVHQRRRTCIGTGNDDEISNGEHSSSSTSSDGELVVATSLLEKSNKIVDNRCRIVETNENNHGDNEEGVEVHVTVSLPVYEE
jgi:Ring finger domain